MAVAVLHNLCILAQVPRYRQHENLARNHNFNEWVGDHFDDYDENENYGDVLQEGRIVRQRVVEYLEQVRNQH